MIFFSCGKGSAQNTIETIGDVALYASPAIVLSVSLIEKDKKGLIIYAKGAALNAAVTLALKEIVKKERPNGEDFNSFPSGHTSGTFQAAAHLQKRYGWKYGIPAYAVASYTAYSRVHADKHFVEDALVGATLGIVSSYLFTKKRETNIQTSFSFHKATKGFFVSYSYRF